QAGAPAIQTPLSYTPFTLDWSTYTQNPKGLLQTSLGVVFSFRGFGNSDEEFANKRFKGESDFAALRWDFQYTRPVFKDWGLALRTAGQGTGQPLVSNEQFFAGGLTSVRGYLESEILGDEGVLLSGELRAPSLTRAESWASEARPYVFLEGARVTVHDPLPNTAEHQTISSAGAGIRVRGGGGLDLPVNAAYPFRDTTYTKRGDVRGQFSASYKF